MATWQLGFVHPCVKTCKQSLSCMISNAIFSKWIVVCRRLHYVSNEEPNHDCVSSISNAKNDVWKNIYVLVLIYCVNSHV